MNDTADVELICHRKFPNGISVQSMGRPLQRIEHTKGEETMSNLSLWHNNTLNNLSTGLAQDPYRESCHSASSQSVIFCNFQQRYWTVIIEELLNAWPDGQRNVIAVTLRLVSTFQSIISRGDFKTCDFLLKSSQRKSHSTEERRYSVNFSPKINTDWSDSARERFFAMRFGEKWNFDQKLLHRSRPNQLTESYSESFETKCFSNLQQRFGRDTEGKSCFVFRTHRAWGESKKNGVSSSTRKFDLLRRMKQTNNHQWAAFSLTDCVMNDGSRLPIRLRMIRMKISARPFHHHYRIQGRQQHIHRSYIWHKQDFFLIRQNIRFSKSISIWKLQFGTGKT